MNLRQPRGQLRVLNLLEGLSYILLLGLAMPLKYLAGRPEWVRAFGSVHGALFVLLVIALWRVRTREGWTWGRALGALGATLVPLGALWLERELRRGEAA